MFAIITDVLMYTSSYNEKVYSKVVITLKYKQK